MKTYLNTREFSKVYEAIKDNKWLVFIIALTSILYVLPLILANTYYVDDLNRTVAGYNWDHDGRFASSKIMHLLSFQAEVVYSLYPYSNMLSAVLLSFSGFIIAFSLGVRRKIMLFVGSLLLTTCPFLLEILAYRFDCIPISLSIFCIAFPFLFYQNRSYFSVISIIGITLSLGFYQTSALSYCIILCFFLIKDVWNNQYKNAVFNLIIALSAFIISFLIYKWTINLLDLQLLEDKRGDFIFKDDNLKILLKDRFYGMYDLVKLLVFSSYRYVLYVFIFFSFVNVLLFFKNGSKVFFNKYLLIKLLVITVLITFVLIFAAGINMFVYEPRWVPRAMIGWSVAIYLFYFTFTFYKVKKIFIATAFIPFIYYSFLISSQFGIYLKNQDEFSDYIINLVSPKLLEHDRIKVIIKGTNKTAHRNITVNYNTMPFIYKLAPIYENNDWGWGIIRLNKFDNISSEYIGGEKRNKVLEKIKEYPIVDKNIYYTLRIKDDIAIIDFERTE